jgi:ATP-dependent 26S proteasome regulatory subunit
MAADRAQAEAVLAELRRTMRARSVYRGRIISLEATHDGVDVKFHRLPKVERDGIILPEGILERIERQTVRFSELREELLRMGRHLKRGLLLYGPPGTGKTLTAMYLAARMPERTTLLLTGRTLGLIEQSCAMARLLQPATVILEDVDLVAEERTRQGMGSNAILFELLNQMDGLADDADVLFVLTTNRPEILEPALASRPGRIDQAIEIPLPDEKCRARLLDLYGRGLAFEVADRKQLITRTKGVSAAFIRELLRRAALFAADEGARAVGDRHLDVALHEIVVEGGKFTHALLGTSAIRGFQPS